jgi:hypothetical protein
MSEQQIAKLAGALVEHQRHFDVMSTSDRQWVIQNTGAAIGLFAEAVGRRGNGIVSTPKKLLELVTTVKVDAIASFAAGDHFKRSMGARSAVKIYSLDENFKKHLLGKVESASAAAEIKVHKLLESSLNVSIIAELADKYEITCGRLFALLSKQGKGEAGPLIASRGRANVAFIRDMKNILWAVNSAWFDDRGGWYINAQSVGSLCPWPGGGNQVLSD